MSLTEACIKKPVFAWMLMAATLLFGGLAAQRIGVSQYPDVDFPTLTVSVSWEGAAPEVMEHDVVEPLEEALVQVEGIRNINSTSRQGSANVTLELDISRDVDVALQDVQTRVSQAQQRLPRDIDPPVVSKSNPEDQPIMWVGINGPYSPQFLSDFARFRVKERLQTVPGVGEVMMGGSVERNVRIWLDAEAMDARDVTVSDLVAALQREHVELPAGRIEAAGREVSVRVEGEALDLDTLRNIVVREQSGAPVYVGDVALVEDGFEDLRRMARINGVPGQGLGIKKQRGANAVAVAQDIRARLDEIRATLPEGMELGINFDSTRFIEESVEEIEFELLLSVLLTGLVCWLFLGSLSSTLNVVLAIPMSLMGTIAIIYFMGFTLNTFTLLGLSLAVGIVVDDAIMVMENIFRHAEMGKHRLQAAREGTAEITFAALAATAAVIAIFLPVVFMQGVVGKFFYQFGVTLSVAVALSYLEAITLAPARCAQLLVVGGHARSRIGALVDRAFARLEAAYAWVLAAALRRSAWVLVGAALLFFASVKLMQALPGEFVPSQDQSRLMLRITTAVGSSLQQTDTLLKDVEAYVNQRPEVQRSFLVVGGFGGAGVNGGVVFVTLVPPSQREQTQAEFAAMLRKDLGRLPGVRVAVQDLSQMGFGAGRGFPVEFSVRGPDWDTLVTNAQQLMDTLRNSGLVVDLDSDYQLGMPELTVRPDRARAADLGVSVTSVASTLGAAVGGTRIGKYSTGGRRVDVRVRLLADQRTSPEDIERLKVRSDSGALVPLSSLVTAEERPALQAIMRKDRERAITVSANVAPGKAQADALKEVEKLGADLPTGYRVVLSGASVTFRESMDSLFFALGVGILVSYMVLASQFNSFLHPVTVLTILPLSIAGAAGSLFLAGKSLNIYSMIGLLLLMGIVKKNSIILVDYANQLRDEDPDGRVSMSALQAMLKAGPVRLRPILMTSIATMMAALPPAMGLGAGSEIRTPMAIAVLGGVLVSTALSLVVVPAFFVTADRLRIRFTGKGRVMDPGTDIPGQASAPG